MAAPFVLNRDVIMTRLGGDEEILGMMIEMFLQDHENNCRQLAEAWQAGDARLLMREAHTVKGLLATISDEAGADEAYVVERQAKLGEIGDLGPAVEALQARLREVASVLARG